MKQIRGNLKGSSTVKFLSFKNGLSAIIDRLEEILVDSVEMVKGVQAEKIEKGTDRYQITLANGREVRSRLSCFSDTGSGF